MRAVAEFIMRGRMQATAVVMGAAVLPLFFWLSAAAVGLVLLRRGVNAALSLLFWGALPALVWWHFGEPRLLLVLLGTAALAQVLRATVSWPRVLLMSVPLGLLFAWAIHMAMGDALAETAKVAQPLLADMLKQLDPNADVAVLAQMQAFVVPVLAGIMAAMLQVSTLLSLLLARWWQSQLYNPGGFATEFQALRLNPLAAISLLGLALLGPQLDTQLAILLPVCTIPLVVAGVALLHGLKAQARLATFWLVGLYAGLVLLTQLVLPLIVLLAVADSLIDFRGRKRPQGPQNPADGEG
ncbi:hypothetical protein [Atopomonas sediminilitoris]|uniref:hypothetical protein n=1 Tax=Atopomonas sediminilitoris TaxID=2919919 RepID=UPI001F4E07FF|nr:hypothetical protein [Atopomonas sediminilitoris]MCJ8170226.1 hypothetical protein [Atopomonas sediminilitoris]